jgi:hypothetical protein
MAAARRRARQRLQVVAPWRLEAARPRQAMAAAPCVMRSAEAASPVQPPFVLVLVAAQLQLSAALAVMQRASGVPWSRAAVVETLQRGQEMA